MRSVVATATLVGTLSLGLAGVAAAQEPEPQPAPAPPPPASRQGAVPRGERIVTRDSESKTPDRSGENRAPAGRVRAAPEAANNQPASRETEAATQGERRRPPTTSSASVANNNEGETERRGAVRRAPNEADASQNPRDRAVPRTNPPYHADRVYGYPNYRYNRYYDPWGYGAFGLGFYYWPWGWSPGYYGYGGYGGGYGYSSGYDLGSLKLKVKPRDAEVFVDGYFAGTVDDFDGIFQALKLDRGAYRIEIRKPGYTTLQYDVRVQPERTLTIRGEMKPEP